MTKHLTLFLNVVNRSPSSMMKSIQRRPLSKTCGLRRNDNSGMQSRMVHSTSSLRYGGPLTTSQQAATINNKHHASYGGGGSLRVQQQQQQQHRNMVVVTKTSPSELPEQQQQQDQQQEQPAVDNNSNNTDRDEDQSLQITPSCVNQIHALLKKRNKTPEEMFLRVFVDAGGCSGFTYQFELDDELEEDEDIVFVPPGGNGARVVVDETSLQLIQGSKIDYVQEMIKSSFVVADNPQSESACGCGSSFAVKNFSANPALD